MTKPVTWTASDWPTEETVAFAETEQPIRAMLFIGKNSRKIYRREFSSGNWEIADPVSEHPTRLQHWTRKVVSLFK